jgi:hypothetical protein
MGSELPPGGPAKRSGDLEPRREGTPAPELLYHSPAPRS